jgi:hypothetical protein
MFSEETVAAGPPGFEGAGAVGVADPPSKVDEVEIVLDVHGPKYREEER